MLKSLWSLGDLINISPLTSFESSDKPLWVAKPVAVVYHQKNAFGIPHWFITLEIRIRFKAGSQYDANAQRFVSFLRSASILFRQCHVTTAFTPHCTGTRSLHLIYIIICIRQRKCSRNAAVYEALVNCLVRYQVPLRLVSFIVGKLASYSWRLIGPKDQG